jgi:Predicted 3'-5' exonuclease related to the exonuclease domain of PolB
MSRYNPRAMFDDKHLAILDIETISSEEMEDGGFPPWATHVPVVASVLIADRNLHDEWTFEMTSIRFGEDDEPFEQLEELLQGRSCVSFGGNNFDFRVLMLAAQSTRNHCLPALTAAATEPRYASAKHYDLADKYSNYGAARGCSLTMLCESLGIAAKVSAHGSEVRELHDQGKIDEIVEYCEGDVLSTALAFANCRAMEKGDPSYHASLTSQLVRWIHAQGHDHLIPFAEIADLGGLLRLSLVGQIDAARRHAELNIDLQAKRALDASFSETIHY